MGAIIGLLVALFLKIQKPFLYFLVNPPPLKETGFEQPPPIQFPGSKGKEQLPPLATLKGNLSKLAVT